MSTLSLSYATCCFGNFRARFEFEKTSGTRPAAEQRDDNNQAPKSKQHEWMRRAIERLKQIEGNEHPTGALATRSTVKHPSSFSKKEIEKLRYSKRHEKENIAANNIPKTGNGAFYEFCWFQILHRKIRKELRNTCPLACCLPAVVRKENAAKAAPLKTLR